MPTADGFPESPRTGPMIRVCLVEDPALVREGISSLLRLVPDIEVVAEATDGENAISIVPRTRPDSYCSTADCRSGAGLSVLRDLQARGELPPTIVLTTFDDEEGLTRPIRIHLSDHGEHGGEIPFSQRWRADHGSRVHLRMLLDAFQRLPEECRSLPQLRVFRSHRRLELECEEPLRFEARVNGRELGEAATQQAGAHEEHEGERKLRHHERVSETPSNGRAAAFRAVA